MFSVRRAIFLQRYCRKIISEKWERNSTTIKRVGFVMKRLLLTSSSISVISQKKLHTLNMV